MAGGNKVIIVGNLGQDPEVRYIPSGGSVVTISVATSDVWKDQQGQRQEKTEWHRITLFNKLGDIAGQYLKKGSKVYVEGKLQTRKWQDKNTGQDRYTTDIVANELKMLDSRSNNQEVGMKTQSNAPNNIQTNNAHMSNNQQDLSGNMNHQNNVPQPISMPQAAPQKTMNNAFTPDLDEGWDDEIPF